MKGIKLNRSTFGNQTISLARAKRSTMETHGFASLPRDKFAFIGCGLNRKELRRRSAATV